MKRNKEVKYADKDFTLSSLPSTRFKQIFDLIRHERNALFTLGLLLFFLGILFVALTIYQGIFLAELEQENDILLANLIFDALRGLLLFLFSFLFAGAFQTLRRLSYGEGLVFWLDFRKGIGQNAKGNLSFAFFLGVSRSIISFWPWALSLAGAPNWAKTLLEAFAVGFFYLVALPLGFYGAELNAVYSLPLSGRWNNAARLYLKHLLPSLAFGLIPLGIYSLTLIPSIPFIAYASIQGVVALCFVFYLLSFHQFVFYAFDQDFNHRLYPSYYRKGLCPLDENKEK